MNDEFFENEERTSNEHEQYNERSPEEDEALSAEDRRLFAAVERNDTDAAMAAAAAVQQAIRDGANVNAVCCNWNPLMRACAHGSDPIIRILLDAGADTRWCNWTGSSAITKACENGNLSAVQLLINHDNGLLETVDDIGWTPLIVAILGDHSDIVRFLLDSGADPHHVDHETETALMRASRSSLEIVRLLLAAGVDVEACDGGQQTALYYAVHGGGTELMLELILQHNANMFAVDEDGRTPFDSACHSPWRTRSRAAANTLLEEYGNKLTQDHGRLALHELLKVAVYSFSEENGFHPPLNPLRIILPLGKLTIWDFRTLLHTLDAELIYNRDYTGKLPIHIACQTSAPVEVLALILEYDPTTLHFVDFTGALPILLCAGTTRTTEYASVRYLVEQGGVGTLAARNIQGLLPLHVLCGSTNPPVRAVQYLIQSFPGSVAVQTNAGQYPFMMAAAAAAESSWASLSVIYELVRANPGLVVQK